MVHYNGQSMASKTSNIIYDIELLVPNGNPMFLLKNKHDKVNYLLY